MHRKNRLATVTLPLIAAVAALWLSNCSFMPDELEAFFALPLPEVERGTYNHDQLAVSYVQTGNPKGMPVIFVHGSPGSWEDWKLVIERPRLKARFNLIAVNRPGWDDRSTSAKVVPEISAQSKMLHKILDIGHHRREKVILVGHSLGGPIILRMAADYPEKIAAVVLLAPSLDPDLDAVLWYNRLADYKLIRFFLPQMLIKSNDEIMALPNALRTLAKDLASIRQPVVLVHGEKDQLVHPANAVYAQKKLINAIYHQVVLPNFGHLIPHLRPAEVVIAIEETINLIDKPNPASESALLPARLDRK